tara:strand:+ start:38 stop:493 length:456 start_codon:yes stop_codon:yes gene_type:complete
MESLKFTKGSRYDMPLQLSFFTLLSEELQKKAFISKHDGLELAVLFTGRGLKEKTELEFKGIWQREENLLIYMIDELVQVNIIIKNKLNSLIEHHFKINNVASQRYSYEPRKPQNYKEIDSIIISVINKITDDEESHRKVMAAIIEQAKEN